MLRGYGLYVFGGVLGGVLTLIALAGGASGIVAPLIGFPLSGLVVGGIHLLMTRNEHGSSAPD